MQTYIYKSAGGCDLHADVYQPVTDNGPRFFGAAPSRVALIGHSAVGYLALMGGVELVPRVNGVVSLYGYGDIIGDWYSTPNTFYRQEPIVSRKNAYSLISDVPLSASEITRRPFYLYCRQHGVWTDEVMALPRQAS